MALTDGIATTKTAMAQAVAAKLDSLIPPPPKPAGMSQEDYEQMLQDIHAGYERAGAAIAEILEPVLTHIKDKIEIGVDPGGLITSDVSGAAAVQNNPGKGLVK